MKFSISKKEFVHGLARIHGIADKRSSMPVLANVLLNLGPAGLRISATNLHVGITGVVPAEIEDPGAITVAAKTLFDIVKNIPGDEIRIVTDENQCVRITAGRVKYKIAGIPAVDFPDLPSSADVEFFSLNSELLKGMIEKTSFAVSKEESRAHLNGALFEGDGKALKMVATDGHRLSMVNQDLENHVNKFSMLIPLGGIQELRHLLDEGKGDVEIGVSGSNVFFRRNLAGATEGVESEVTINVKLVDARFPPYQKVIPSMSQQQVRVGRTIFLEALRRTALISRDKSVSLRLTFEDGKMTITSDNPNIGEAREEIDAQYEGESLVMGFNGKFLTDVLQALDSEMVELSINGPADACVIRPPTDTGYLGVVMPIRL